MNSSRYRLLNKTLLIAFNEHQIRKEKDKQTLQPALPKDKAIAFPIPLEAPVTITTGDSTSLATSTAAASTAVVALTPVRNFKIHQLNNT